MPDIPREIAGEIARIAVEIARARAPRDTGAGALALEPVYSEGYIGITGPEYMMIQDKGFEKFDMVGLAGLVVPIRTPSGRMIFRTASPSEIGRTKLITRDGKGSILKPAWQHPGLAPKNFIEDSIKEAIGRWIAGTPGSVLFSILGRTEYRVLTDEMAIGVSKVGY
jgi:hypothetical protein